MVLTVCKKQRLLAHYQSGNAAPTIKKLLEAEGLRVGRVNIWRFLKRYSANGCLGRQEGSGRPSKLTENAMMMIEEKMQEDDETTATQFQIMLTREGYPVSLSTIKRSRKSLGWTYRGSAYCQLIKDRNKEKKARLGSFQHR